MYSGMQTAAIFYYEERRRWLQFIVALTTCISSLAHAFGSEILNECQILALKLPRRQGHDCSITCFEIAVSGRQKDVWKLLRCSVDSHLTPHGSSSPSGNHPFGLRLDCLPGSNIAIICTGKGLISFDALQIRVSLAMPNKHIKVVVFPFEAIFPWSYCHFSFSYQIIRGRWLACWMAYPVETAAFHIRKF